jgi:periplasmic protein TonB
MVVDARRRSPAFLVSLSAHCGFVAVAFALLRPSAVPPFVRGADGPRPPLIWLDATGPGRGGGGSGNQKPEPPRRAERPGDDANTLTASTPQTPAATSSPVDRDPLQRLVIPVVTIASGVNTLPGAIDAPPALTTSQGPGRGGNAGAGNGTGDGPGNGPGLGRGRDGGTGGDVYRPGGDVTMPIEIRKGTPQYTTEAMRARAQGAILVQCVVQTNGVCSNIRVLRSFNPSFGLDQEAIKAASQWRFRPGVRRGQPVPVVVTLEVEFAVR